VADDGGMRLLAVLGLSVVVWTGPGQQPAAPTSARPAFHLYLLGHEIGAEHDTLTTGPDGPQIDAAFHFDDRSTPVDLVGSLQIGPDGAPRRFTVKGRTYRLFRSDAEVMVMAGRAHVRDLTAERDVDVAGRPFFPIDNYAPIGIQEALIRYWLAHGRPTEIEAPPAGVVRISQRAEDGIDDRAVRDGVQVGMGYVDHRLLRLAIDGVVWGRETAWVEKNTHQLIGLTTWAGQLPFEAVASGYEDLHDRFVREAAADRVADLVTMTRALPPVHDGAYALTNALVVDATGRPAYRGAIRIAGGRIVETGPDVRPARGETAVDLHGATVIPGLWDTHAHAGQIDWSPVYLASGVTTIRDMGGEDAFLVAIRDAIASGRALGPRYLLAGLVDGSGPKAFGNVWADTPDQGRAVVRRYHAEGFQQMKIYDYVTPDVVRAIADEAHRLGMTVTGHVPHAMTWQTVVEAGYDHIAHMQLRGQPGSDASNAQIAFFRTHGTVMDPTQSWNELAGHAGPLARILPGVDRLPQTLARLYASMPPGSGRPLTSSLALLRRAVDAGLLVVAGTDKGVPGFSLQRELELYVQGGMTPMQALQTATLMPARAMQLDRDLGTIEAGKRADLTVLAGDPLDDIANIRTAELVVTGGRLYDCNALWRAAGYAPR
jgi:imidazolonepropionase-like amidohydrolase